MPHFNTNMIIIYSAIRAAIENMPPMNPVQKDTIKSIQVLSHDWAVVRSERVRDGAYHK